MAGLPTIVRLAGLAALLGLCACGGGSGAVTDSTMPPVDGGNSVASAGGIELDLWLAQELAYNDRDGDGIEDALDPWPDQQPILANPGADGGLSVIRAWTEIDGQRVADTAIEDRPLLIEFSTRPGSAGAPWVIFHTGDGLRASKAVEHSDGIYSVEPWAGSQALHIVAGASRGTNYSISSLRTEAPVLFASGVPLQAGAQVSLAGRNLDRVHSATLGNRALTIVAARPDLLTVQLPPAAAGALLAVETDNGQSNPLLVDLRQSVQLRVAADLPLPQGEELRVLLDGKALTLTHASPVSVSLPATRPAVLSFDILNGNSVRSYRNIRAVAWPGDAVVDVSARSTLLARMIHIRHLLPDLKGTDWQSVRSAAERALTTVAAADYVFAVSEHAAGRRGPAPDGLLNLATASYRQLADESARMPGKTSGNAVSLAPETETGRSLDSVVASVVSFIGENRDNKNDPDTEAGFAHPEQLADQVFGEDYAQVIILPHKERDTLKQIFRLFNGCNFSSDEQVWYAVNQGRVWDSDLCIEVGGLMFISAAVVTPGFEPPQPIFDAMDIASATGTNRPLANVRRHSRTDFYDTEYQLGAGGYYLRADDGAPLCHMETCYIEVITSGYGAYKNVRLTENQKALVTILRTRMWAEGLIPWMLSIAGILPTDPIRTCLRDDLLQDGTLKGVIAQFDSYIDSQQDKSGLELIDAINTGLDTVLGPWARKYVRGQFGDKFINCVTSVDLALEVKAAIESKLLQTAGLSTFTEILAHVRNLGSAIFTPEKFVFKIQYRAEIRDVHPRVINLYDESADLTIDGDWLLRTDPGQANPCSGDGYCPELIITDKFGTSMTKQLDQSHVRPAPNCGIACTRLSIPIADMPALQDLVSGPLHVELAYFDADYGSYPNNRLRVPVPGNSMQLSTRAKIYSINPPLVKPGEEIVIKGTGFDSYGSDARFELSFDGDQGTGVPLRKVESSANSDAEVHLQLPVDIPRPLALKYAVVVIPGLDAPLPDLDDLESQQQLLVSDRAAPVIVVGDMGKVKDDEIHVTFLDENDYIVTAQNPIRTLSFDLPIVTPASEPTYVYGQYWDDETRDANDMPVNISADIRKVRVKCVSAGVNAGCTWAIRSLRDKICIVSGVKPRFARTHIVEPPNERIYELVDPATDLCP